MKLLRGQLDLAPVDLGAARADVEPHAARRSSMRAASPRRGAHPAPHARGQLLDTNGLVAVVGAEVEPVTRVGDLVARRGTDRQLLAAPA